MSWPLIVILIALALLASAALATAAPWLPTWRKDLGRILALINLQPGQKFYDLGCGDGRLICAAGSGGAQAVGIELSLFPYLLARAKIAFEKNPAKIIFGDFFRVNLNDADAVYLFLTPPVMLKIKTKLEAELKPGAKIVSYHFAIPDWSPAVVDKDPAGATIYLYAR